MMMSDSFNPSPGCWVVGCCYFQRLSKKPSTIIFSNFLPLALKGEVPENQDSL
jgi:hypothetical protein